MFYFYVRSKLACCSRACHDLETRLHILPVILGFLWRGLFSDFIFSVPLLPLGLGFAGLWASHSLAYPFILFVALTLFPAIPPCYSCCDGYLVQACWASLGLLFMTYYSHLGLFSYIACGLLHPICFLLGILGPFAFLGHFPNSAFPWAFFYLLWASPANYLIPHPWGSWACHQPVTFFACITLGLLWPILTFPHHILPMGLLFLSFWAI